MTTETPGRATRPPGDLHPEIGGATPASFPSDSIPRRQHLAVCRACGDACTIIPLTDDWHFTNTLSFWFAGEMLTHHNMTATRYERNQTHIEPYPVV